MKLIEKYFPNCADKKLDQFRQLQSVYQEWNDKINVISRKDIDKLYERHVLHSLAIAKFIEFNPGAQVLDFGTGGGFPGVPLAIMYPDTQFHLVDSIRKKLKVVDEVSSAISLSNLSTEHTRVEDLTGKYDFIVCRAVAQLSQLMVWTRHLYKREMIHGTPNGLIALKGGDLKKECAALPTQYYVEQTPISTYFLEDFFKEKHVIFVQV